MLLQMAKFYSFLWLSSITLCIYICVCVTPHIFIHSSVDGHLSCFHILAIVNNTAIGVCISFRISEFCEFLISQLAF